MIKLYAQCTPDYQQGIQLDVEWCGRRESVRHDDGPEVGNFFSEACLVGPDARFHTDMAARTA